MTVKIDHLKYKVTTRPNPNNQQWGNTEFVYLNLVFSVDDEDYKDIFLSQTKGYSQSYVFLDTELFEKDAEGLMEYCFEHGSSEGYPNHHETNLVRGYQLQNSMLHYLEKFDKFWFHEYFYWCGTTQGAVNDLRLLQNGYNPTRTTDACFLDGIITALSNLWD